MKNLILVFSLPLAIAASYITPVKNNFVISDVQGSYTLSSPAEVHTLPPVLNEVSGITDVSSNEVGCVQDEKGTIFIYDVKSKKLGAEVPFSADGDYEGLTVVGNTMYVLRSDGQLTEVKNYRSKNPAKTIYQLGLPTVDNEGLGYDEAGNRILVAAKSKAGKGKELKDKRLIFAFDLKSRKVSSAPVLEIDIAEVEAFAAKKGIRLPQVQKKNGQGARTVFRFLPSSVAVHPLSKNIYVLSAADPAIAVFDSKGKITDIQLLDKSTFRKPEGITFMANGDMFISNEAEGKEPNLLKFHYKKH